MHEFFWVLVPITVNKEGIKRRIGVWDGVKKRIGREGCDR
jgi:hypothetical protein